MIIRFLCSFALYISCIAAYAQPHYTPADSMRAKAYWDSSWNYGLHSREHQQYLDSALMVIPTHAYYWQQKSMPLYKMYKYQLAIPYLDSAVKYDPHRWMPYRAYMRCIFEKNYRGALADFYTTKAQYNSLYVMDHPYDFFIALCHLQLNNFDSSSHYLHLCIDERAKKHGKDWVHHNHLFYLGITQYEKHNYTDAIATFDDVIRIAPQFADVYYYKAICQYMLRRYADAKASIAKASAYYTQGYTIREDGALYEPYPYQVRKYFIQGMEKALKDVK
ncbi:hypothetical protein CAP35_11880 [Chitinophagaceae bacterium IBVUCB1]|nr:hypothetical protein CAP35_11880 [Chitinophagaceae bacterium IBVUCB1]